MTSPQVTPDGVEVQRTEHRLAPRLHFKCGGLLTLIAVYFIAKPSNEILSVGTSMKCDQCGFEIDLGKHDFSVGSIGSEQP